MKLRRAASLKKFIAIALLLVSVFALCACGETFPDLPQTGNSSAKAENSKEEKSQAKTADITQYTADGGAAWEVGQPVSRHYTVEVTAGPRYYFQNAVPVKNTGSVDLFLNYMDYTLNMSDGKSEHIMGAEMIPKVIRPGETTWIMLDAYSLEPGQTVQEVSIRNVKAEASKMRCLRFDVSELEITEDWQLFATGTVTNNTSETSTPVHICIFLYDTNGELLGSLVTIAGELAPGESNTFKATTLGYASYLHPSDIGSYEVFAGEYSLTNGAS